MKMIVMGRSGRSSFNILKIIYFHGIKQNHETRSSIRKKKEIQSHISSFAFRFPTI